MTRFDGKSAIVTGGARGLGAAVVERFVADGARVAIADLRVEEGKALADHLGEAAMFVELDVSDDASWAAAIETVRASFGGLDILVNNAGIVALSSMFDTSLETYQKVIGVNQIGVFLGMKAAGAVMAGQGSGSIVNVSSTDGLVGGPGQIAYCASKHAVNGMTKVAALELAGTGVRVNAVNPGAVDTPMHEVALAAGIDINALLATKIPLARSAAPAEIANVIAFFASDEASYSTGACHVIDGGWLAGY
ncbi:SDR family NAD(P)-dependent oxidoreductase [Sporichthya sp.]|uniref:SDR family NAD(P)-dependent oxidoreductase n=1 Tax=Sporichthya sp. TaxID=65475 RepID=UPI001847C773|nr:glucose 1-dehydrogenase [Sporichthya sp.]MBA3743121.1 glucose 1-dehydrogenase [Sporichthya sp.]